MLHAKRFEAVNGEKNTVTSDTCSLTPVSDGRDVVWKR